MGSSFTFRLVSSSRPRRSRAARVSAQGSLPPAVPTKQASGAYPFPPPLLKASRCCGSRGIEAFLIEKRQDQNRGCGCAVSHRRCCSCFTPSIAAISVCVHQAVDKYPLIGVLERHGKFSCMTGLMTKPGPSGCCDDLPPSGEISSNHVRMLAMASSFHAPPSHSMSLQASELDWS